MAREGHTRPAVRIAAPDGRHLQRQCRRALTAQRAVKAARIESLRCREGRVAEATVAGRGAGAGKRVEEKRLFTTGHLATYLARNTTRSCPRTPRVRVVSSAIAIAKAGRAEVGAAGAGKRVEEKRLLTTGLSATYLARNTTRLCPRTPPVRDVSSAIAKAGRTEMTIQESAAAALAAVESTKKRWWSEKTVAVVTGSNKGIGYDIVRKLAMEGLTVVLTSRDEERGKQAVERLASEGLQTDFHQLDVSSEESIHVFADWLREKYGKLDILVNNAGILFNIGHPRIDEAHAVMNTNYVGVKKMCEQMMPLLRASDAAEPKIVNVGSEAGSTKKCPPHIQRKFREDAITVQRVDELVEEFLRHVEQGRWKDDPWMDRTYGSYSYSKMVLGAYTRALAKELSDAGSPIRVNIYCPGWCRTAMGWQVSDDVQPPRSAEDGSEAAVWLALTPPEGAHGQYFVNKISWEF
ncbi:hypothetical protein CBR_g38759 [Chara braunii]|uniref:Uncharacterized protein n=1 Tax=Chara braunii TaxID=69332 RepID=A0A388LQF0_CHABU|nr:hypothetical protein CBR_g38759 [Chara braunii]|eukprot:GBG84475.1 hypothetical protein CBR_g38759 [Chara braunii]